MAISGNVNLFELGFRFYHDPNLRYEITPDSQIRIDPATGKATMFFGMRDYLVDGVRTRKQLKVVQGAPTFFLEAIDETGQRNWDGVKGIRWDDKGTMTSYNDALTAPERISDYYNADTACPNDNTQARVAFVFCYDNNDTRYKIKNSDDGSTREVYARNTTTITLNKNEYIYGINSHRSRLLSELKSGIDNAFKIEITFDLAYDFTGQQRGLNFFTMPDTVIQVIEYVLD